MPDSNLSWLATLKNDAVRIFIALDNLSRGVGVNLKPEITATAKLADVIQDRIDGTAGVDRQSRRRAA